MAPALVALIAPIESRPSSSSLSSTPHAKAPCAPPPCSARLTGFRLSMAFGAGREIRFSCSVIWLALILGHVNVSHHLQCASGCNEGALVRPGVEKIELATWGAR